MIAIEVKNLSKTFRVGEIRTSFIKHILSVRQNKFRKYFLALKNLNFTLPKGEMLGIIGPNGSGKTTLLKIIAGILFPTEGEVRINGEVNFFLQLGIGFQAELTARENIYLYGALLGMNRSYIIKKFNEIINFAELQDFIDTKLKYYSTGMYARLAFSTAIQAESDILLLDEILAVGDQAFQKKCLDTIRKFKQASRTIILVSHSLDMVKEFCKYTLYLDKGEQIAYDETKSVIDKYK